MFYINKEERIKNWKLAKWFIRQGYGWIKSWDFEEESICLEILIKRENG